MGRRNWQLSYSGYRMSTIEDRSYLAFCSRKLSLVFRLSFLKKWVTSIPFSGTSLPTLHTLSLGTWVKAQLQGEVSYLCSQLDDPYLASLLSSDSFAWAGNSNQEWIWQIWLGLWCSLWPSLFPSPFDTSFYGLEYYPPDSVIHLGLIAPTIPGTNAPWVPSGALGPGSKPIWLALFASPPGKGILQNVATLLVGNKKYWTRGFASPARWQFKKQRHWALLIQTLAQPLTSCVTVVGMLFDLAST